MALIEMITKTIFLIQIVSIVFIGTFGYDERNLEIKNLVDSNEMLDNYNSWNDAAKIIKLAKKVLNEWKFNPNELGLDQVYIAFYKY